MRSDESGPDGREQETDRDEEGTEQSRRRVVAATQGQRRGSVPGS